MPASETLVLTRDDVAGLLTVEESIAAVEESFQLYGEGKAQPPEILGVHTQDGGFHIKAGILPLRRRYFAAKVNANFPNNRARFQLPTIQGVIVLSDADNGSPLAIMDSIEITLRRTAAASAVAAKWLARDDASVGVICGCGAQARAQLEALAAVRPLERVYAYDVDESRAQKLADDLAPTSGFECVVVDDFHKALRESDICVTCTTATEHFIDRDSVPAGLFIAAVGADSAEKQELDPSLVGSSVLVVDVLDQCATIGELHHALKHGVMSKTDVHAELAEVVAGKQSGRTTRDEIIIFDSTGMALQDVAAAAVVYEKALRSGCGVGVPLTE